MVAGGCCEFARGRYGDHVLFDGLQLIGVLVVAGLNLLVDVVALLLWRSQLSTADMRETNLRFDIQKDTWQAARDDEPASELHPCGGFAARWGRRCRVSCRRSPTRESPSWTWAARAGLADEVRHA